MCKSIFILIVLLSLTDVNQSLNYCGDWHQFKASKCFKILMKKDTQAKAQSECLKLDNSSSLATIKDQEEQDFLNGILKNFNNFTTFAWIGMKFNGKDYKWTDGTDSEFTNWSDDAVKSGEDSCVKMLVKANSHLGKWVDSSCKRRALIVCQRTPELSLNSLKDIVQNLSFIIQNQQNILIPMGFLYTQLPNESAPGVLWPFFQWSEVTEHYAGLFFRAEGKSSEPFGQIQQANQSIISNINVAGFRNINSFEQNPYPGTMFKFNEGWNIYSYKNEHLYSIGFHKTSVDVRPINTAVRIWKRIG